MRIINGLYPTIFNLLPTSARLSYLGLPCCLMGLTGTTRVPALAVISTKNTRTMSVNLKHGEGFDNSIFFNNKDYIIKDTTNMPILTLNNNIHLMICYLMRTSVLNLPWGNSTALSTGSGTWLELPNNLRTKQHIFLL